MKPTRLHYFYAYKLPVWIWIIVVPQLCVVLMAKGLGPPPALCPPGTEAGSYLMLLGLAWLLGWAGSALVGPFVLGPIYFHRARLNGAPFQVGDPVRILVGPCRGRVVRVLASVDGRGMVTVYLGETVGGKRKRRRDTFEETQLLRVIEIGNNL